MGAGFRLNSMGKLKVKTVMYGYTFLKSFGFQQSPKNLT